MYEAFVNKYYLFNPIFNKSTKGAVKQNVNVTYQVKIANIILLDKIYFVYTQDSTNKTTKLLMTKVDIKDGYSIYEITVKYQKVGHYWYHFEINEGQKTYFLQKTPTFDAEPVYILHNQYMQLVYKNDSKTTKEFQGGVMYHIFVDRFNKYGKVTAKPNTVLRKDWGGEVNSYIGQSDIPNNEFFGGNLKGIIHKLDYLKSLNVNTIYLSPIFESPSNHKYDTADYSKIDSMFGNMQDLQDLISQAKQKNINIILDGVFNHTGSDSVYFNKLSTYDSLGAYQSKSSKYFNWYNFSEWPNKYDCWWGVKILPQINENNPEFIKFMTYKDGIVPKYMRMGLLGFRLDVVDELSQKFLDALCKCIRKVKKDAIIIGEVWEDASNKIAYSERRQYFLGDELDSVMNYPLKNAIIDYVKTGRVQTLLSTINMLKDHYPKNVQNNLMNILGTHDTARILTVLGLNNVDNNSGYGKQNRYLTDIEYNNAVKLLKQASLLQYTLMGVPCIYYGDEAGLQGIGDPFNRACFPWGKEDKQLLTWYTSLGKLRENNVFKDGETNILYCDGGVICFERAKKENRIIVAINKNEEAFEINLTSLYRDYFTNKLVDKIQIDKDQFVVLIKN